MRQVRKILCLAAAATVLHAGGALAQGLAFVLNSAEDTVSILDSRLREEIARVPAGREPHHLMMTPDGRELIIANARSNDLIFVDPANGAETRRLRGIADPYQIGFSPDGRWFVSNSLRLDRVDIYDAKTFERKARIRGLSMPSHMSFSPDSKLVFVTLQGSGEVVAIETETGNVVWRTKVGPEVAGILTTDDGNFLYAGIMGSDYVAVVDWRAGGKLVNRIKTGKGAHNVFPWGDGRHVLVTNRMANSVSMIDTATHRVVRTFAVPGGPDCLAFAPDRKELWVTSRWAHKVQVVDTETFEVVREIPVGRSPHGIYLHTNAREPTT